MKPLANDILGRASHASRQLLNDLRCLCVTMEWGGDHSCREMHPLRSHIFPEKVTRLIQQIRAWLDNRSVVDVARQSLCQKSSHQNPTNMGRFRELAADLRHNNTHIKWTKGHTENNSLKADLNREADACCAGAFADEFSFVWPCERRCRRSHTRAVVIGDGIEAEAKATKPLRRLTACHVMRHVTQSLYSISRITIGSNAAVFGVRWVALWPCPKGVTIYIDSNRVGETAEQPVKRQVPGLTATERSALRSVCCGAWTGHECRSDGSCLNCETGSRPTWEHMLVCTQLNFDMIDFSEIPQTIVDELRKTIETDTFAACAMMPKSYWTPPRGTPVEHEARRREIALETRGAMWYRPGTFGRDSGMRPHISLMNNARLGGLRRVGPEQGVG